MGSERQDQIDAIQEGRLAALGSLDPGGAEVCAAIGRRNEQLAREIRTALQAAGIDHEVIGRPGQPAQLHALEVTVVDGILALDAAAALEPLGFTSWERLDNSAGAAHRRMGEVISLARTTDVTTVIRIRWIANHWAARLHRSLRPTAADYALFTLPRWAWPAHVIARPVRLVLERVGWRRAAAASLGPFLSTPDDLVEPLLRFASVGPDDVLIDVGSGDGRIPIAAARLTGCRAIGVEVSPDLVARARAEAQRSGLSDRVEFRQGDAATLEIGDATVAFVFLPADVTARIIPSLLAQLGPGGRVIAHEQHRLPDVEPAPAVSHALVHGVGVTVAHRWG